MEEGGGGGVEGGVESGYWLGWFSYSTTFIAWASKFRQESSKVKLPQLFKLTIPPLCVPINTFYNTYLYLSLLRSRTSVGPHNTIDIALGSNSYAGVLIGENCLSLNRMTMSCMLQ